MNYPSVRIIDRARSRIGRRFTQLLKDSHPGPQSDKSNIIFQWGQQAEFEPGKITVIFDCGYFMRDAKYGDDRHYRFSINEKHPTGLPSAPPDRWYKLGIKMENLYDPNGHILLVGRGGKTRKQQGSVKATWEGKAYRRIREKFPDRKIIYRPKKLRGEEFIGDCITDSTSSIRQLCSGCALIYTQWSNVGNEGILYGIPVITQGGPARDICDYSIRFPIKQLPPSPRQDFLIRLAYWQWSVAEIRNGEMWPWLFRQIENREKLYE